MSLTLGDRGELVVAISGTDLDALNSLAIVDRIEAGGGALDVPDTGDGGTLQITLPAAAPAPAVRVGSTTPPAGVPG